MAYVAYMYIIIVAACPVVPSLNYVYIHLLFLNWNLASSRDQPGLVFAAEPRNTHVIPSGRKLTPYALFSTTQSGVLAHHFVDRNACMGMLARHGVFGLG